MNEKQGKMFSEINVQVMD